MNQKDKVLNRFWSKVIKTKACWEWQAGKCSYGYGRFKLEGRYVGAHRYSYVIHYGELPKGLLVMHSCDNPSCVNPNHLSLGTNKDNMDDKVNKGRQSRLLGSLNGRSKFTENQILEMRDKYVPYKYSVKRLAQDYNISEVVMYRIIHRILWKHI